MAMSKPFAELKRKGIIANNPVANTIRYREKVKTKVILTLEEVAAFFACDFYDERARVACRLAMASGLRISEVLGLQREDLNQEWVEVAGEEREYWWIKLINAWNESQGLRRPKRSSRGDVPVPTTVAHELMNLHAGNPHGDGFVFYGDSPERPIDATKIRREYQRVLVEIGIDAEEQAERGINAFHAWRHFYASHMKSSAMKVLRHTEAKTTERYMHLTEVERRDMTDRATRALKGSGL